MGAGAPAGFPARAPPRDPNAMVAFESSDSGVPLWLYFVGVVVFFVSVFVIAGMIIWLWG